jgi:RNA polymerase sigma factor (sigma-70 family)
MLGINRAKDTIRNDNGGAGAIIFVALAIQPLASFQKNFVGFRPAAGIYSWMMSDLELLDQYARQNREEAFAALLDRHLQLVYSAALRQVRSPELAEEVAQSVFSDLARSADKLEQETILTAWLYQVTRRTAINVVRAESRRQLREQIALDVSQMNSTSSEWTAIEPLLDEAMEALDPPDRTAILLRYFEDKSLREVGRLLGTSEDTAQKRVSRAVDQLREFFTKRGHAVGVGGLSAVISANAVQSAPVGLKAAILASAGFYGAAAPVVGKIGITKTLAMTTLQKTLIGAALAASVGTGLYQAHRASAFQEQLRALPQQPAPVNGEVDALRQQIEAANRQLAEFRANNDLLRRDNDTLRRDLADLPGLRGEVERLRENAQMEKTDPTAVAMKSWLERVKQVEKRLEQTPGAKIPEFQYLTQQDWLNVSKNDLNTDEDYRLALSALRNAAENTFITTALRPALNQYAQANNGQFPSDISQLTPFFNPPVDSTILQRWEVAPPSTVPNVEVGGALITQISPVDANSDGRYAVGMHGYGTTAGLEAWGATSP